jgi:ABC-2 type transport system ATP-binding protein
MSMNHDASIRIDHVSRSFGNKEVLHKVTLDIKQAEIFGLLGPSGSGKTTLVRAIAGIDEATSGEIHVLGTKMPKLDMLGRIGYMAQSDAMYMELTAKENIEFFGSLMGVQGTRLKQRMETVLELVNLSEHRNKQVGAFSGGMKRRLSLAIALLHEPKVLILDEPTVGIDPVLRKSIWDELLQLSNAGTTILVTTHVMDEAEKCHRLGMIRDGRVIASGSPEELKLSSGSQTIEEVFLYYGGAHS